MAETISIITLARHKNEATLYYENGKNKSHQHCLHYANVFLIYKKLFVHINTLVIIITHSIKSS